MWTSILGFGSSVVDFAGDLIYTEQERAQLDAYLEGLDLERYRLDTLLDLEETRAWSALALGSQSSSRTQSLAMFAVLGAAVIVGGWVIVKGS